MTMLCSWAATDGGAAATVKATSVPADKTMTQVVEDVNPPFLVVMLLGFSMSSQLPNTLTPRTTRPSEFGHSGIASRHGFTAVAQMLERAARQRGRALNLLTSGWQTSSEGMQKLGMALRGPGRAQQQRIKIDLNLN